MRVKNLGVGDWLNVRHRSGGHLARALARIMRPAVRERCRAVAGHFGKSDGLAKAAEWMEELAE